MHLVKIDRLFARFQKTGDPHAMARVFDATVGELLAVATYLCRSGDGAEDLVQSTFLTAIEKADRYDPTRSVLPWLMGILVRHARARRRVEARSLKPDRFKERIVESPSSLAARKDVSQCIATTVRDLPAPYREVLVLHLDHGLTAAEIAEALGRPAGTVRTQVVRGLEKLRSKLPSSLPGLVLGGSVFTLSLASVRATVLTAAKSAVGTTVVESAVAASLGGFLVMNKVLIVAVALGLMFALWWSSRSPDATVPEPRSSGVELDTTSSPPSEAILDDSVEEIETIPSGETEGSSGSEGATDAGIEDVLLGTGTWVEGQVLDLVTGAPVHGARLEFHQSGWPKSPRVAVSDEEGVFRLDECNVDMLLLESMAEGYPDQVVRVQLVSGSNRLDVQLDPGIPLEIEVLDLETRDAIPGASVTDAGRGRPFGVTEDDGRLLITGFVERIVDPQIDLCVVAEGFCGIRRVIHEPDQLRSGQRLRFLLPRAAVVRGTIRDPVGAPVEGVTVRTQSSSVWSARLKESSPDLYEGLAEEERVTHYIHSPSTTSDASGSYRLEGVLVGLEPLRLGTYHESFVPEEPVVLPEARHPGEVLDWDITMRAVGRIKGRVFVNDAPSRARVMWEGSGRSGWGSSDDQGRFVLHGVEPGRVVVKVFLLGVEPDVSPSGSETVEVAAGSLTLCEVRIEIQHLPISGRVVDARGNPVAGLRVLVIGVGEKFRGATFRAHGSTDGEGRYSVDVPNDPDGSFDVSVLYARGLSVDREEVGPGTAGVDFEIPKLGRIPVKVFDVERRVPITRFEIEARSMDGIRHRTDAGGASSLLRTDGVFELELPVGIYDLVIRSPDLGLRSAHISAVYAAPTGQGDPLEVRLRKKVEVTVQWSGDPDRFPHEGHYLLRFENEASSSAGNWIEIDRSDGSRMLRLDPGEYRLRTSPDDITFEPQVIRVPDEDEALVRVGWGVQER